MHTLPLLETWFGWTALKAPLCGSSTPWQAMQKELEWHLLQRPGDDSATLECIDSQPPGCGICRPWQAIQKELEWHLLQRPGDDSATLECIDSQPPGCGIC